MAQLDGAPPPKPRRKKPLKRKEPKMSKAAARRREALQEEAVNTEVAAADSAVSRAEAEARAAAQARAQAEAQLAAREAEQAREARARTQAAAQEQLQRQQAAAAAAAGEGRGDHEDDDGYGDDDFDDYDDDGFESEDGDGGAAGADSPGGAHAVARAIRAENTAVAAVTRERHAASPPAPAPIITMLPQREVVMVETKVATRTKADKKALSKTRTRYRDLVEAGLVQLTESSIDIYDRAPCTLWEVECAFGTTGRSRRGVQTGEDNVEMETQTEKPSMRAQVIAAAAAALLSLWLAGWLASCLPALPATCHAMRWPSGSILPFVASPFPPVTGFLTGVVYGRLWCSLLRRRCDLVVM